MATLRGIGHEVGAFLSHRRGELSPAVLSDREVELLQLAADGLSGPEIARRLSLSPATVKTHFENIYARYGVPDRVAAVARALRQGVIR
jgi:DNA-binding CsgD family transcriptional regulator